jgi:hypothetical protein
LYRWGPHFISHMLMESRIFIKATPYITVGELRKKLDEKYPELKPKTFREAFSNAFKERPFTEPYRRISPKRIMDLCKKYEFNILVVPEVDKLSKVEVRVLKSWIRNSLLPIKFDGLN